MKPPSAGGMGALSPALRELTRMLLCIWVPRADC